MLGQAPRAATGQPLFAAIPRMAAPGPTLPTWALQQVIGASIDRFGGNDVIAGSDFTPGSANLCIQIRIHPGPMALLAGKAAPRRAPPLHQPPRTALRGSAFPARLLVLQERSASSLIFRALAPGQ